MQATQPNISTQGSTTAKVSMTSFPTSTQTRAINHTISPSLFADTVANDRLLERCRQGDKEAVTTLLSRFESFINRFAYQLSGNYDDAGDVVSESYIRLSAMLGTCRSAAALPSWVRRVVSNAACDLRRRSSRNQAISLEGVMEACGDACLVEVENNAISPQDHVENNERSQILDVAISSLPVNQQSIIRLFYLQELSHDEISSHLGLKVGTVKSRLSRARESLLNRLSDKRALLTQ